jgi:signal transduction histidine kinase
MSTGKKSTTKKIIITCTVIAVIVLPYTQYQSYLNTVKITHEQLNLNSLRSQLMYIDDATALASRSFILSGDEQWHTNYKSLQENFNNSLLSINSLFPEGYEGKGELMRSHAFLVNTEEKAFLLTESGQAEQAKKLLSGNDYVAEQIRFSSAKRKLINRLDTENGNLFQFLKAEAIKNIFIRAVIVLALLLGWLWFSKKNSRWKKKLNELEQQRLGEEREAAKKLEDINGQLRKLSTYLQDVREKERMSLASEINEELGQQIAAMKLRIAEVKTIHNASDEPWQMKLEDIAIQLDTILSQIRNLATEVYPLILRDLGLAEAIQWESERVTSQSGAVVNFTTRYDDINLDHRTTTTLFRTYQQKLQNCLRHGAKEITSSLHVGKDVIFLSISDDGAVISNDGIDLMEDMALRERLQSIKGHCETHNSKGNRNSFTVTIPYTMQQ